MVSARWLKKTELFENLDESQLDALMAAASVEACPEGMTIFDQGDEAKRLYVLIEGNVELTVKAQEEIGLMTSRLDKEGSVFGTPSLMEPFHYNVRATCLTPSQVLVLEADLIKKKMEEDPRMGVEIMGRLASIYFNRLNELRSGVSNLFKIFRVKMP